VYVFVNVQFVSGFFRFDPQAANAFRDVAGKFGMGGFFPFKLKVEKWGGGLVFMFWLYFFLF